MRAVGVDLGGTKIAVAVVAPDGSMGEVMTAPTPALAGGEAVLDAVADLVTRVTRGIDGVAGVGVGTAGVVDATRGSIISATDTFASWVGTDIAAGLRSRLGWDATRAVEVRNDVDAHALGEAWLGAGRGRSSMLMVAVGTGVGGAVVLDGRLWTGAHHVAGEMGHIPTPGAEGLRCPCGVDGHLEAVAAGPAIERAYAAVAGETLPGPQIMAFAATGAEPARRVVTEAAVALGRAIAGVATVLDPECVVIGGGVARAGDEWWAPLRDACRGEVVPVLKGLAILPAALGPEAAILGAARTVFDAVGARMD
ncbi:ROK family protein [Tessaracoccus sp. Y1736]